MSYVKGVKGHTAVRHGLRDWRCTCGTPLSGPRGTNQAAARTALRDHVLELRGRRQFTLAGRSVIYTADLASVRGRLLSRLIISLDTGCLLWSGRIATTGYGHIKVSGHFELTHRVMWELLERPIPEGLELDHVKTRGCTNRHCASIAHLEPVTGRENNLRGTSFAAINAAKSYCDNNHEFTPENTYIRPNGNRDCRACNRDRTRRYKERKDSAA